MGAGLYSWQAIAAVKLWEISGKGKISAKGFMMLRHHPENMKMVFSEQKARKETEIIQ